MFTRQLISDEARETAVYIIKDGVKFSTQYFILLVFSIIIATLGLIIDNGAIVIGAMIIAPFIWPIIGFSLSMVTGDKRLLRKSLLLLFASIVVAVAVSMVISLFSPFQDINREISSRTAPTIIDLIIALATGSVAVLIICWSKQWGIIAGVAVAASLVPPISVTGIGLAFGVGSVAYGSLLLFLTNLVAVVFIGMIVFALLDFQKAKHLKNIDTFKYGLAAFFIFLIALSIPLIIILRQIVYENQVKNTAQDIIGSQLRKISNDIKIDTLTISTFKVKDTSISIDSLVHAPAEVSINLEEKNAIAAALASELGKQIDLQMTIVPTISASTPKETETEEERIKKQAEQVLLTEVNKISSDIVIESVKIDQQENDGQKIQIETVLRVPEELEIDYTVRDQLAQAISSELDQSIKLEMNVVRFIRVEKKIEVISINELIQDAMQEYLAVFAPDLSIVTQAITEKDDGNFQVDLTIRAPVDYELPENFKEDLISRLNETTAPKTVELILSQITYEVVE